MSETIAELATFLGIFVANVVIVFQNRRTAKHNKEAVAEVKKVSVTAENAAVKIESVRTDLIQNNATVAATAAKQEEKLDRIHELVNGDMSAQKELTAIALRKLADVTGNGQDIENAEVAEQSFMAHRAKLQRSEIAHLQKEDLP